MATAAPSLPGERIAKVLSRAGIASRRDAERMILDGRVSVNGRIVETPAFNVLPTDRIEVDGTSVGVAAPPRLWLYHKPEGLVTSARDEKGRPTVFDHLPPDMPRVMPVGRLDLNSEGLLLLTNDGALKRRLELPSTGWLRRYRVRVNGRPDEATLDPLRRGITVEGERFQPMTVTLDRQQGANAWLTVGLREGRNREIRRALAAVGLIVNRLIRTGYGPFALGTLAAGAVEEVRGRILRDQLGIDPGPISAGRTLGRGGEAGSRQGRPGAAEPSEPHSGERPARRPVRAAASDAAAAKGAPASPGGASGPRRDATDKGKHPHGPSKEQVHSAKPGKPGRPPLAASPRQGPGRGEPPSGGRRRPRPS
jgi:23S rRNA pseudouridine2605 synthase